MALHYAELRLKKYVFLDMEIKYVSKPMNFDNQKLC